VSDRLAGGTPGDRPTLRFRVLAVDPAGDRTATTLERTDAALDVTTVADSDAAVAALHDEAFDCVVAAYVLPDGDGVALLERVREEFPDLPFVIWADDGDESIASDAIAADVTEYVPRGATADWANTLADRVETAVTRNRQTATPDLVEAQAAAMEASIDGMAILDADGVYQFVNRAHAEAYGYDDPEAFVGEHWTRCYDDDEIERFEHEVLPAVEETGSWRGEATGLRADGSTFPQAVSLTRTPDDHIVCVVRDITERKTRERRIEEQARRLDAILDTTPAAVFMKNAAGEYTLLNDTCAEIFGFDDPEEGVGCTDFELFPEEAAEQFRRDDERVLETGEPVETEDRVPGSDGVRQFLVMKSPVFRDGEPAAVCGVATDITDLKRREAELERERNRLDEFADIVSHDLRNPLNVASGALSLVAEETDSDHVARVADAHDRIERLIEDLLALARQGEAVSDPEPVTLDAVAQTAWAHVTTHDGTLDVDTDAAVRADRSRLKQVFENLFRNAVEHGSTRPDSQARQDAAEHSDCGVTVEVGATDTGFYVADDGPGIPEDEREDVFEAGYTTSSDGNGLGLRIVQQVAEAHGWRVTATDSESGGARFEFRGVELT
jgi:PAS domain S-box-containing protein